MSISARTAWQLVWSGQIPSLKIGPKLRRVRVSDLDSYLARLAIEAQANAA